MLMQAACAAATDAQPLNNIDWVLSGLFHEQAIDDPMKDGSSAMMTDLMRPLRVWSALRSSHTPAMMTGAMLDTSGGVVWSKGGTRPRPGGISRILSLDAIICNERKQ